MKKLIYTVVFALVAMVAISCTEQNIKPSDGGGASDRCQFGGPGCPKT